MDPTANLPLLIGVAAGAVILLGAAIGAATVIAGKRRREMVDAWARGAYGLWTGGEDCAGWPRDRAENALHEWYGITGTPSFWNVIEGLKRGQTGNVVWDRVRALDLLRIGIASTTISPEQFREEAVRIGRELQSVARSWEELAQAFEAGMNAWQRSRGITDASALGRVQANLPRLRAEVWPRAPFDAELVGD